MNTQTPKYRIDEKETSRYIGFSRPWLREKRMRGGGPPYIKVGRSIRYDVRDLDRWLDEHRVER